MSKREDAMADDKAKHNVLPPSRFGVIEMTRQRVRPEVSIVTEEVCPSCNGTGKIGPTLLLADQIETNIDYLIRKGKVNQLTLAAHPFVISYYREGWPSRRQKWWWKYKKWVKLDAQSSLPLTTVKYLDEHGEEIKLD
jgi:ribonuclease G